VRDNRLAAPARSAVARATSRWPYALAPRGLVILAAGLVWILPAVIDRRAIVMMALWNVALLAIAVWDLRRLPDAEQLEVTREWSGILTQGTDGNATLTVRNGGAVAIDVALTDFVHPSLCDSARESVTRVAPGRAARTPYTVRPRDRGDVHIGVVTLRWRSDWALAERWATAPLEQTVRVYPNLVESRREWSYLVRSRQTSMERRRVRRARGGREFEALRDYQAGDEKRDVCWTASARRGKLVTKIYVPERSQAVWVLVDGGRLQRARDGDRSMLDHAVMGALALSQVALESGDRVGLLTYGRRVHRRVAPGRGATHLRDLVDALAVIQADSVEADHATAAAEIMSAQRRRALVVWLTDVAETAGTPDVIEQASAMTSRHAVLFAVMRHPAIHAVASDAPETPAEMYRLMAAQEAMERRAALLSSLGQRGALIVEVSPAELAGGLVDRYLEIKDRGVL